MFTIRLVEWDFSRTDDRKLGKVKVSAVPRPGDRLRLKSRPGLWLIWLVQEAEFTFGKEFNYQGITVRVVPGSRG